MTGLAQTRVGVETYGPKAAPIERPTPYSITLDLSLQLAHCFLLFCQSQQLTKHDNLSFPCLSDLQSKNSIQQRKIPIPPHRMTPLRNDWLKIYTPLVEHLKLQVRMNVKSKSVEIRVCFIIGKITEDGAVNVKPLIGTSRLTALTFIYFRPQNTLTIPEHCRRELISSRHSPWALISM